VPAAKSALYGAAMACTTAGKVLAISLDRCRLSVRG
jgi:hypothetical protein